MEQIIKIAGFVFRSFIHIWPYLLVTIPFAVVINLSGASKYINSAFGKNPMLSVLLATIVGAFSPFCSCGVIPVISSLLIGGVPLAPVMSFWIASPSMDPEIFFLSSSVLGWKLAVWRLASTFIISLFAGFITHFATKQGFIGSSVLRTNGEREKQMSIKQVISSIGSVITRNQTGVQLAAVNACCATTSCCTFPVESLPEECECNDREKNMSTLKWKRIYKEVVKAALMVTKFMGIAFLITALITFYLPKDLISGLVSGGPAMQVILATLIGIPMYTSNITALPMVGSLIELGLNKGAALAFLIAGATTTLPAMVAVWGITKRRVFILYLSFALVGAFLAGFCFNLFN